MFLSGGKFMPGMEKLEGNFLFWQTNSYFYFKMLLFQLWPISFLNLWSVQKASIYITLYVLSAHNGVQAFIKSHLIFIYAKGDFNIEFPKDFR